ncbi:MAG: hypothetical protein H6587_11910 [Flavobacteriales bacterium]|nr:hypothetical protein [Flavobacteriales bacterium]MCB9365268.1 hypothetical protein [Flavobacteriales bacterium]
MVRIIEEHDSIRILIAEKKIVGINEWKYIVRTFQSYFTNNKKPIISKIGNEVIIKPFVKRAFKYIIQIVKTR